MGFKFLLAFYLKIKNIFINMRGQFLVSYEDDIERLYQ